MDSRIVEPNSPCHWHPNVCDSLKLLLVTAALHVLVYLFLPIPAAWVEAVHAHAVFPAMRWVLGAPLSVFPFSVGQIVVVGVVGLALAAATLTVIRRPRAAKRAARALAVALAIGAHVYLLGFGWLYHRPPLSARLGLVAANSPAAFQKAALACARDARDGRCTVPAGLDAATIRALAVEAVRRVLPELGASALPPTTVKQVIPTGILMHFGVSGVFSPFTQEPNVDPGLDPIQLASVAAHEVAHLAGFASEDEANFVAWLACTRSPEPMLRYAGHVALLATFASAANPTLARQLRQTAGPEVQKDRRRMARRWAVYYSRRLARVQRVVYDKVLRSQGVRSGIHSYGEVVRLVLSWLAR